MCRPHNLKLAASDDEERGHPAPPPIEGCENQMPWHPKSDHTRQKYLRVSRFRNLARQTGTTSKCPEPSTMSIGSQVRDGFPNHGGKAFALTGFLLSGFAIHRRGAAARLNHASCINLTVHQKRQSTSSWPDLPAPVRTEMTFAHKSWLCEE
jgi:hypothetical protein